MGISYGSVYVAKVAMGAKDEHTLKAFIEAESYPGPSIIIAYSHCIAHGINMAKGMQNQKMAVDTGYWQLFRYNPLLREQGQNPFKLDSKPPAGASIRMGVKSWQSIAWLLERSPAMLPIPGTSKVAHLEENVAAAAIRLTAAEMQQIG